MRRGFSSGDDPDYQFIFLFMIGMGDQDNHNGANQAYGLPAFLSIDDAIQAAEGERIFKDKPGSFQTDLVFREIEPVLLLIPDESHNRE
jgi:hypothetical protein